MPSFSLPSGMPISSQGSTSTVTSDLSAGGYSCLLPPPPHPSSMTPMTRAAYDPFQAYRTMPGSMPIQPMQSHHQPPNSISSGFLPTAGLSVPLSVPLGQSSNDVSTDPMNPCSATGQYWPNLHRLQ